VSLTFMACAAPVIRRRVGTDHEQAVVEKMSNALDSRTASSSSTMRSISLKGISSTLSYKRAHDSSQSSGSKLDS